MLIKSDEDGLPGSIPSTCEWTCFIREAGVSDSRSQHGHLYRPAEIKTDEMGDNDDDDDKLVELDAPGRDKEGRGQDDDDNDKTEGPDGGLGTEDDRPECDDSNTNRTNWAKWTI